jgi:catechol 2,3-dioxygenase-like lactoylglutathione lyase family enzyme
MSKMLAATPRLPVADLKRTVDFYVDLLGFRAGCWPQDKPTFAMLERDGVSLQFYVPDADDPPARGIGAIGLDVDDARPFHDAVKDRVKIEWGPEVYWYGRREFSFKDPDGYAIIIGAKTDDPVECAED